MRNTVAMNHLRRHRRYHWIATLAALCLLLGPALASAAMLRQGQSPTAAWLCSGHDSPALLAQWKASAPAELIAALSADQAANVPAADEHCCSSAAHANVASASWPANALPPPAVDAGEPIALSRPERFRALPPAPRGPPSSPALAS